MLGSYRRNDSINFDSQEALRKMSGCPVHSPDDSGEDWDWPTVRWDLVFLGLALSMLAAVLVVATQIL